MRHPEIVAALQKIYPQLVDEQVDYWLEWMHYTVAQNMDNVFDQLLTIFTSTEDEQLRQKIGTLLQRPFRERRYVNKILVHWEATGDALLETLIPRKELWGLAGQLKPFFPGYSQLDIQTQLYDIFGYVSIPDSLPKLLNFFLEDSDKELHRALFEFFKNETSAEPTKQVGTDELAFYIKDFQLNAEKVDVLCQLWEETGNPELYEIIPKQPYWELCGQLKEYFPNQPQTRIQYNITQLFDRYQQELGLVLDILLRAYQNELKIRKELLQIFAAISNTRCKDVLCQYWLLTNDPAFEPFIERTEDWELAGRLVGKLSLYKTRYLIQHCLQIGRNKARGREAEFLSELLNFAIEREDTAISRDVLQYLFDIGEKFMISERWEKTRDPVLEPWLPHDERWEMAAKVQEIYPNLARYGIYIWLDRIKTAPETALMKNYLRIVTGEADAELQKYLLSVFGELKNEYNIMELCRAWAETRHPALELVINQHNWTVSKKLAEITLTIAQKLTIALKTLNEEILNEVKTNELRTLVELSGDSDAQIAQRAAVVLRQQSAEVLPAFAKFWKENRQPLLLQIIVERDYLPETPAETRLAVALHLDKLAGINFDKRELVPLLVEIAEAGEAEPAQRAQQLLQKLKKSPAQQTLCQVIIQRAAPRSQQIALNLGLLPTDNAEKALFYFVTGQFEKYEGLDFDGRLLRAAYQNGDVNFKKRLTGIIRASGRLEYLGALVSKHSGGQTAPEEAELTIQMLQSRSDWGGLWAKVMDLPLQWSAEALRLLTEADWQPTLDYEQELLVALQKWQPAASKFLQNPATISSQLPLALLRAETKVSAKVTDLAFSPVRPWLAISTADKKVAIWNLQEGRLEHTLTEFERVINRLVFTPAGTLVCAERSVNQACNLYAWNGQELGVIGQHSSTITTLDVVDENRVIAASRSQQLKIWNTQTWPVVSGLNATSDFTSMPDWARNGSVSPDRKLFAALTGRILYYSLPELEAIGESNAGKAQVAEFAPDNQSFVVGRSDGKLRIYERGNKGEFKGNPSVLDNPNLQKSPTVGLAALPGQNLLLVATENGNVEFFEWAGRTSIGRINVSGKRLTALKLSPDTSFMAAGDWEAGFSLWDLRPLQFPKFLEQPLAVGRLENLAMLQTLEENVPELSEEVRAVCEYARLILRHRYRFAVELADAPNIQAGEFDIEL